MPRMERCSRNTLIIIIILIIYLSYNIQIMVYDNCQLEVILEQLTLWLTFTLNFQPWFYSFVG